MSTLTRVAILLVVLVAASAAVGKAAAETLQLDGCSITANYKSTEDFGYYWLVATTCDEKVLFKHNHQVPKGAKRKNPPTQLEVRSDSIAENDGTRIITGPHKSQRFFISAKLARYGSGGKKQSGGSKKRVYTIQLQVKALSNGDVMSMRRTLEFDGQSVIFDGGKLPLNGRTNLPFGSGKYWCDSASKKGSFQLTCVGTITKDGCTTSCKTTHAFKFADDGTCISASQTGDCPTTCENGSGGTQSYRTVGWSCH